MDAQLASAELCRATQLQSEAAATLDGLAGVLARQGAQAAMEGAQVRSFAHRARVAGVS